MALAPLATVADIEARGVAVDASETEAVTTYLDVASALVRDAAGSPVSETTSTVTLSREHDGNVLPGAPVTSVTSVLSYGEPVRWGLRGQRLYVFEDCAADITVTYVHGLPEVPADITDIVCRLAVQELVKFRESPESALTARPVIQERIGDYSVTYGYTVTFSDMELPDYLRKRLAARFGNSARGVRSL